jgi:aryl-alcohol dehydrogenase-like predicted oxidoreductase
MQTTSLGRNGRTVTRIGLGGMPLSTEGRPDREQAKRVVRRAVELGITLIDTADVYCLDDADTGHNERLIREALDEIGARERVLLATKGGMTRPGGRWERDGRPEHLRLACERSLRALGTEQIELYQFHVPDPQVPFAESVGALARLQEEGKVAAVGLSNVSLEQLREAEGMIPVASVQNRFNPWDRSSETEGVIRHCEENGTAFLPYSPVGGGRRVQILRDDPSLGEIARTLDASPEETVIAWTLTKSPAMAAIPGASRTESIESSVRAEALRLGPETVEALEALFPRLPQ